MRFAARLSHGVGWDVTRRRAWGERGDEGLLAGWRGELGRQGVGSVRTLKMAMNTDRGRRPLSTPSEIALRTMHDQAP